MKYLQNIPNSPDYSKRVEVKYTIFSIPWVLKYTKIDIFGLQIYIIWQPWRSGLLKMHVGTATQREELKKNEMTKKKSSTSLGAHPSKLCYKCKTNVEHCYKCETLLRVCGIRHLCCNEKIGFRMFI
jgi:hypothetical protein